ncbi:MAG: prolyl aminopeptidase [Proteobacteria bacterium]|nr:prolyl aminopeptidase [Pseudomonadota bacterium]
MHTLYPAIKPYQTHELDVGEPHTLYVEEVGNPQGIPVIVLHPGPGAGGDPHLRRFFDPQIYRIIIFDQRGCGRSKPHLELRHNNTELLLDDIEKIREYFKLEHFILFGSGWGSTLALLYSQLYPQQIMALLLQQIFLGRKKDIDWYYKTGASLIYPDYWQEFINIVPTEQLDKIPDFYANCMQGNNDLIRMSAAKNWALWQAHSNTLQPHFTVLEQYSDPHFALTLATIESHYIKHHYFIQENEILANTHKIKHIPTYLIHGRYDMICPLAGAWDLHQALPSSQLRIVRDAGHSDREPGMIDALICASKEISKQGLDAC